MAEEKNGRCCKAVHLAAQKDEQKVSIAMDMVLHNQLSLWLERGLLFFLKPAEGTADAEHPERWPRVSLTPDMGSDGVATQSVSNANCAWTPNKIFSQLG